jgi:hypothetical protein
MGEVAAKRPEWVAGDDLEGVGPATHSVIALRALTARPSRASMGDSDARRV